MRIFIRYKYFFSGFPVTDFDEFSATFDKLCEKFDPKFYNSDDCTELEYTYISEDLDSIQEWASDTLEKLQMGRDTNEGTAQQEGDANFGGRRLRTKTSRENNISYASEPDRSVKRKPGAVGQQNARKTVDKAGQILPASADKENRNPEDHGPDPYEAEDDEPISSISGAKPVTAKRRKEEHDRLRAEQQRAIAETLKEPAAKVPVIPPTMRSTVFLHIRGHFRCIKYCAILCCWICDKQYV